MKNLWLCIGILTSLSLQGFCELEESPSVGVDYMGELTMEENSCIDPCSIEPSYMDCMEDSYYMDPCNIDPNCMENCYPSCRLPVNPCIPCPPHCSHWLVSADFLCWQLRSEELPFAVENVLVSDTGPFNSQTMKRVKPDFQPGVRLELDYESPCFDGWDFCVQWTYFHSNKSADAFGQIFPIWLTQSPNTEVLAISARANHKFTINMADFTFGRAFCAGKRLVLHPSVGIRAVWMNQNLKVAYGGILAEDPIFSENKINCRGCGARVGLDAKLALCNGFSFLARSNFDLLWTKFSVNQGQFDPSLVLSFNGALNSIRDYIHTITPVVELFLGFEWERLFCNASYYVNAHIGWEEQYFLNGIQFNQYSSNGRAVGIANNVSVHQLGSLGLGGLTLGITVGF